MKIVTAIYELVYEGSRGGGVYKSFPLLTETMRNIIFEDFEYVIYTNKDTYQKYNLNNYFNKPNIEIKFVELNSEYYLNKIEPIRQKVFNSQEIYDRIYTVKNYLEVILNKLQFMLNETNDNENVIWIDSGLFGTSCHDRWRDYMVKIAHTKTFLIKLNECVDKYNFICIRGNQININYELKQDILELFGVDLKIIPGGIFGGKSEYIKQIIGNYKEVFNTFLECKNKLISEQEVLSVLTSKTNTKFFEINDWLDFQRGILEIMDLLTDKYKTDSCYE
jgi:hypothetical protein